MCRRIQLNECLIKLYNHNWLKHVVNDFMLMESRAWVELLNRKRRRKSSSCSINLIDGKLNEFVIFCDLCGLEKLLNSRLFDIMFLDFMPDLSRSFTGQSKCFQHFCLKSQNNVCLKIKLKILNHSSNGKASLNQSTNNKQIKLATYFFLIKKHKFWLHENDNNSKKNRRN